MNRFGEALKRLWQRMGLRQEDLGKDGRGGALNRRQLGTRSEATETSQASSDSPMIALLHQFLPISNVPLPAQRHPPYKLRINSEAFLESMSPLVLAEFLEGKPKPKTAIMRFFSSFLPRFPGLSGAFCPENAR